MKRWRRIALIGAALVLLPLVLLVSCGNNLIYQPHHRQVAPSFPETQAVRVETEDGETLVAWYRAPEEGQPIFLFFDGNAGRPEIWEGRWRRIVESGAGFLAVYYRGYSGSTGRPSERGLHLDARAGYDWLIANGYGPHDIVIHGFSLGSGVAVHLARERPARALILEAPFTSVDDVAAAHFSAVSRILIRDTFRSREWIGDVRMPVLIAHGDADTVIPFAQGERLYDLAQEPKQFVRMVGSDHATLVRDGVYDDIWRFLARHPWIPEAAAQAAMARRVSAAAAEHHREYDWRAWRTDVDLLRRAPGRICSMDGETFEAAVFGVRDSVFEVSCAAPGGDSFAVSFKSCPSLTIMRVTSSLEGRHIETDESETAYGARASRVAPGCERGRSDG